MPNDRKTRRESFTNFFQRCDTKGARELLESEDASFGKTGTFRAKAIARRHMNTTRRRLTNSEISVVTLDPEIVSELAPLNPSIDGDDEISSNENTKFLTSAGTGDEKIWRNFALIWTEKPISLLLIFAPFALASVYREWGPQWVFLLNFLVMVPLASILGDFTEEAALHTSNVIGGLLNASFGNSVEVITCIQCLRLDQIRVVQASLIGSIFSNLLLVLGCCFLFGGLIYREQTFCNLQAMSGLSLLSLSSIAMLLPTPFADYWDLEDPTVLVISRLSAVLLIISYILLLIFQLCSHNDCLDCCNDENVEKIKDDNHDENHKEKAMVPLWMALLGLGLATGLVTFFSNFLVESIDGFCAESGISPSFVGLIILPIVGNAVEHITAVHVARKDNMDLALGVAIGSCTQIALFVVPVTVLYGWIADKPMTLNFPNYEIYMYIISVFTVSLCLKTGKSNWLLGWILVTAYIMLAIGFWFEKVETF